MRFDRRELITMLGIAAGGATAAPVWADHMHDCLSHPSHKCEPDAIKAWKLRYAKPDNGDRPGAGKTLSDNFTRGLEWAFAPNHVAGDAAAIARAAQEYGGKFKDALEKSYLGTLSTIDFSTFVANPEDWVTLNDHAFILGHLVFALRQDQAHPARPLTHRDYLRAQSRLMHAVSASLCGCMLQKKAYALPSLPDKTIPGNEWLPDPQELAKRMMARASRKGSKGNEPASGEIDVDCPLCG